MSKELLLVVDAVANEKGVPESVILEAIEAALATAAKTRYLEQDVVTRVEINPEAGSYPTSRRSEDVADAGVLESPDRQITPMPAPYATPTPAARTLTPGAPENATSEQLPNQAPP